MFRKIDTHDTVNRTACTHIAGIHFDHSGHTHCYTLHILMFFIDLTQTGRELLQIIAVCFVLAFRLKLLIFIDHRILYKSTAGVKAQPLIHIHYILSYALRLFCY